ncbi:MAG: hypothetical protein ABII09_12520 [Planctomycetota bacterium]
MNCQICGQPAYVNKKGFAGQRPFVAKFCASCLLERFGQLFEAVEQSFAPDPETGGAKSDSESKPAVSGG